MVMMITMMMIMMLVAKIIVQMIVMYMCIMFIDCKCPWLQRHTHEQSVRCKNTHTNMKFILDA